MYEWDEGKRQANLAKHGVDFADMDAFEWDTALIGLDEYHAEPRWIAIGFIGAVLYFVAFTERGDNIRIISLRKATMKRGPQLSMRGRVAPILHKPMKGEVQWISLTKSAS